MQPAVGCCILQQATFRCTLALSGSPEEPFCTLSWTHACQNMVAETPDAPGGKYTQDLLDCAPRFDVRNIWICFVFLDNGEKNSDYFGSRLASLPVNHKFPECHGTQSFPSQSVLCQQHISETLRLETSLCLGSYFFSCQQPATLLLHQQSSLFYFVQIPKV